MKIEEIRDQVRNEFGRGKRDPFADPESWKLIEKRIPTEMWSLLLDRSGAAKFAAKLPVIFKAQDFGADVEAQKCWVRIGNFYRNINRHHEAFSIYSTLYDQMLSAQLVTEKRLHKGEPLVWMSDCFLAIGFPVLAKRYLMLSLCEDSITETGNISPETTGTYFRLVWRGGLSDRELNELATQIYNLSKKDPQNCLFPEWILQKINRDWMTEIPSTLEANFYFANTVYIKKLLGDLGDKEGKILETLSDYILSCMPGCRTTIRQGTVSSEIDIVCSVEGVEADFRSELGRYFICECKDLDKPVDFTHVAKFCRVLDSVKSKFGILFSPKGISGQRNDKYAANEPQKLFQKDGIVLVVIDEKDLDYVASKGNFIQLLRKKYERVRLDLTRK